MFKKNLRTLLLFYISEPDLVARKIIKHCDLFHQHFGVLTPVVFDQVRSMHDVNRYVYDALREKGPLCNHVDETWYMLTITDRSVQLHQVDGQKMIQLKSIPIKKFPERFVYLGFKESKGKVSMHIGMRELEVFNILRPESDHDSLFVYKIHLHHIGGPGYMFNQLKKSCGKYLDDVYYYDIYDDIPKTPDLLYDYCTRLIMYETIVYDMEGNRIKSYWVDGFMNDIGYSDFVTPDIFQDILASGDPMKWEHDCEEEVVYGNVLTANNVTYGCR